MSEQLSRTPGEALDQQINELARLRNAGTRSPEFKAWRQATLTLIQRIWPGRTEYAERFRRVPFTPPSTRADREEYREMYERGCAEAANHLKMLRDLCGDRLWSDVDAESGHEAFEPGSAEDDFPTVDLPASPESRGKSAPRPARPGKKHAHKGPPKMTPAPPPPVSPVLGDLLAQAEERVRPTPPSLPVDEARVLPADVEPPPPAPRKENGRSKTRPAKIGKKSMKARLKDLLGLVEDPLGSEAPLKEPPAQEAPHAAVPPAPEPQAAPPPAPEPPRSAMARALEHPERTIAPVPRINPLPEPPLERPAPPSSASHVRIPRLPAETEHAEMLGREAEDVPEDAPTPPPSAARPRAGATLGDMLLGPEIRARLEAGAEAGEVSEAPAAPSRGAAATPPERDRMTDPYSSYGVLEGDVLDSITRGRAAAPPPPAAETPEVEEDVTPEPMMLDASDLEEADPEIEAEEEELDEEEFEDEEEEDSSEFEPGEDPEELEFERATEEFLRNSPVLSVGPRPVTNRPPSPDDPGARPHEPGELPSDATAKARSVEAAVIRALTPMVAELGIPPGQRAVARAALADLARQLDQNEVTWEILREAIAFVMDYPLLARRVLPLLIPYLDRAA